jgi:hypothetical protein
VLSSVSRGLSDDLNTRPKESYQVSKIDYENLQCEAAKVLTRTVPRAIVDDDDDDELDYILVD